MKAKGKLITIVSIAVIVLVAILFVLELFRKESFNFKKSGSLYENMSDFALDSLGSPDELTQAFLESIQYEIKDIDKENMIVTIDISIPVIYEELSNLLDDVIAENSEKDYDDLKQIAEEELSRMFKSGQLKTERKTLMLQIAKVDGSYKIVPSEEWNEIITSNLEELYVNYLKALIGGMTY